MGDWVLDSLVGFLQSPRWTHPLNNFVDEKCVVFDPGEENKFSYTDIHKQYSNLVESLLEQFMHDIGMSSKQFIQTWEKCAGSCSFEKSLTQQIVAADDFLCFKTLMVQRNIDLEKEAWKLVEEQRKACHFQEPPPSYGTVLYSDEESALQQALELSKKEFDLKHHMEEEELRHLIAMAEAQWTTERQQCAQVPTDVCNMPATLTVPNTSRPPTVSNTLVVPAVPSTTEYPAAPSTIEYPAVPSTIEYPAVPSTTEYPAAPSTTNTPVSPCGYNTPPVLQNVEPSEEGSCTPMMPVGLSSEDTLTKENHTLQPVTDTAHLTVDRASHTAQPLTDTTHSTVDEASHTPQPQAETIESEVSLICHGPEPLVSHCDLSGAEAAARWIESAREELSSSPDHTSLHKESPESQESHMRRQRNHLLQVNKAQREKELNTFVANPPSTAGTHKVAPSNSTFSWFRRGKQEDQKLGRTGILCSAIASKLKKNSQS